MKSALLKTPGPLDVNLRAVSRAHQVRIAAPPVPRPLTPAAKQWLKTRRAEEMAAWEAASAGNGATAAPTDPPAAAPLWLADHSLSRGESVGFGVLAGASLAALLIAIHGGAAWPERFDRLAAWVRLALT